MSYLFLAIRAAIQAGKEILSIYNDPDADFQIETKEDHSPLTIADKRAHAVIKEALQNTPYPLLSEEGEKTPYDIRKEWNELWIVDPLDGTKEFIKRNGEFTVNIALVKAHAPVLGVIYVPVKEILYFASDEIGAWKCDHINFENLPDNEEKLLGKSQKLPMPKTNERPIRVVASRSHLNEPTAHYIEQLKQQYGTIETTSRGSSLKLCLVAEGSADFYPRFAPTMEWDTAAGDAIARVAGCTVKNVDTDRPLTYNKENLLNPYFIIIGQSI